MHWEMFTHAAAAPNADAAAYSTASPHTTAYCFTERHFGTATHSASPPHATADAYRLTAPNPGTAPVV